MKILLLPSYFSPENVASAYLSQNRNQRFAEEGWDMVLYTPTPSRGISVEERKEYQKKEHRCESSLNGHLIIHRFSLFAERNNPILRAARYLVLNIKQFNRAVFCKDARMSSIMLVASTPPTQGVMAALVKKFLHIPLVYNLQDIFPDSLVGTGLAKKGGLLWSIGRKIENYTYRNADKIIVISEDFKKNIIKKGVPEDRVEVIYNWVETDSVKPVSKKDNPVFDEFGLDRNQFTVVYAGNLGNAQNITIILDAAKILPHIQFAIFGTGGLEVVIRDRMSSDNLENVHLNPLQPYERVSQVYSAGDVCIVSCKPGLGGSAMPSKTWSIMSCGRPVIASFDEGELKSILESNDCGLFAHAGDLKEFVRAINRLYESEALCERMGRNSREFILNNLTKEAGTQKYVDVIKSLINS